MVHVHACTLVMSGVPSNQGNTSRLLFGRGPALASADAIVGP